MGDGIKESTSVKAAHPAVTTEAAPHDRKGSHAVLSKTECGNGPSGFFPPVINEFLFYYS